MIGPILLAISWLLLRLEGRGLDAIGIDRPGRRLLEFGTGFATLGAVAALQQLGFALAAGDAFMANPSLDPRVLLNGAYVFVLTGAFGLMWARAFVATGSVAAPIGLHLGWNAVSYLVFSAGPLGRALLVPASGAARINVGGWPSLVLNVLLPLGVTIAAVRYLKPKAESRKLEAESWKLEAGSWKLEAGSWQLVPAQSLELIEVDVAAAEDADHFRPGRRLDETL